MIVPPPSSRLGSVGDDDLNYLVWNLTGPTTPDSFRGS